MYDENKTDAQAIIDFAKEYLPQAEVKQVTPSGPTLLFYPVGANRVDISEDIESLQDYPNRAKGIEDVTEIDGFLDFLRRHLGATAVTLERSNEIQAPPTWDRYRPLVYVDLSNMTIVCKLNGHDTSQGVNIEPMPGWGDFGIQFNGIYDDDFKIWATACTRALWNQRELAEFIDDNFEVLADPENPAVKEATKTYRDRGYKIPTPRGVFQAIAKLNIEERRKLHSALNLDTGEIQMTFESNHSNVDPAVTIPKLFFIAVPIFDLDATWILPVRLRYRVRDGEVMWKIDMPRLSSMVRKAFLSLAEQLRARIPSYHWLVTRYEGPITIS